jgi:hypothetical protein
MIHRHIPGKGNGEIIAKGSFGNAFIIFASQNSIKIYTGLFIFRRVVESVIEDFEN